MMAQISPLWEGRGGGGSTRLCITSSQHKERRALQMKLKLPLILCLIDCLRSSTLYFIILVYKFLSPRHNVNDGGDNCDKGYDN